MIVETLRRMRSALEKPLTVLTAAVAAGHGRGSGAPDAPPAAPQDPSEEPPS